MTQYLSKNKSPDPGQFQRALKDRHIQLIALGGVIGSGYFLGRQSVLLIYWVGLSSI